MDISFFNIRKTSNIKRIFYIIWFQRRNVNFLNVYNLVAIVDKPFKEKVLYYILFSICFNQTEIHCWSVHID